MLRSDLQDYSDASNVVKGTIRVRNSENNDIGQKDFFKNNAPYISCTTKVNSTLIDTAEERDMYNRAYHYASCQCIIFQNIVKTICGIRKFMELLQR